MLEFLKKHSLLRDVLLNQNPYRVLFSESSLRKKMRLSRSDLLDVSKAYSFEGTGISTQQIKEILNELSNRRRTWPFLEEALKSNRHPITITKIGLSVGMVIPIKCRYGLEAYRHFLENIRYYEMISDEMKTLDLYEVYLSVDPISFLMRYRDIDLVQLGFVPGPNREESIRQFYWSTLGIYGDFSLESNSRSIYSTKAKVIRYRSLTEEIYYSASELMTLFDVSRGVLWKDRSGFGDPNPEMAFNRLALHQLRQRILEKFEQWRTRDGFKQSNGPPELHSILTSLENFLINETRNDTSSYLGNPSF